MTAAVQLPLELGLPADREGALTWRADSWEVLDGETVVGSLFHQHAGGWLALGHRWRTPEWPERGSWCGEAETPEEAAALLEAAYQQRVKPTRRRKEASCSQK